MDVNTVKEQLIAKILAIKPTFHLMHWPPIKNSGKYRHDRWEWDTFELWKRDEETLELLYTKCLKAD